MSKSRFDKERYQYIKLTNTKSCKCCALTRDLYGTGYQEGAKYLSGNVSSFETLSNIPIGENCFSICDMGFVVMEFDIFNNKEWLKYPIPLEPCPKPSARKYAIARYSEDIMFSRIEPEELIKDFLIKNKYSKLIKYDILKDCLLKQELLPISSKRLFSKVLKNKNLKKVDGVFIDKTCYYLLENNSFNCLIDKE